jgi:branched-chain amino acid transport system ATP-binding protein
MGSSATEYLRISDLHAFYGESHILHGVDLTVNRGEVVTLLGRNGAGRTTTLKSILGLVGRRSGSIMINGVEAVSLPPHAIARLGIGYCPEERGIFASLTVAENLHLPPQVAPGGMTEAEVLTLFPNLKERWRSSGAKLSGGEQQMLAIARILRTGADLLLLDEPTEGLAPVIIQQIAKVVHTLKERGFTLVLVEQNYRFAARLADRHYVVEHGQIIDSMTRADMDQNADRIVDYLKA